MTGRLYFVHTPTPNALIMGSVLIVDEFVDSAMQLPPIHCSSYTLCTYSPTEGMRTLDVCVTETSHTRMVRMDRFCGRPNTQYFFEMPVWSPIKARVVRLTPEGVSVTVAPSTRKSVALTLSFPKDAVKADGHTVNF